MGEDFPYNLRVFDETDDPHGSLTFWADQRFDLVYFLNQPRPIFPECLFVTLRFDDAGHKIITLFFLSFTPCDIAVIAIVAHHLFAPVRDMGTHRRQPFQGREAFACLFVFGRIDDRSFLSQILHAFLREGGTDDVTRQILHRRVVFRRNPVATEDIEAGMPPCVEHPHHLFRDLALFQKHPEDLVPENGFQLFDLQRRRDAEHAFVPIKAAVRHQNVAVGIESKKITKRLDGDHRAGDGLFFRHGLLHKHFQGFPGRAAEGGKQFSIIQKIPAKHLGNTEHEMPVNVLVIVPGFVAPTSSITTTAALAGCVFIAVPYYGIRRNGVLHYLKEYFQPNFIFFPFHVMGEISRTLALTVRLFGNIMSHEKVVGILLAVTPLLFPIVMQALGLLIGVIQAYIFAILSMVYIASALSSEEEHAPQPRKEGAAA